ncbi:MAG: hypothetical protein K6G22_02150, partial [Lachnospiraceae bacterium]|nr:hypothetical protein [Lachnospiraceae bacterium]
MTDIKKKPRLSILLKIALLFICALVISAAFTITFSYLFMIEDAARQESEIARVVATSVRADLNTEEDITRLEQDAEFRNETHDMFKNICLESGARYLYLYKLTEDNKKHYLVIAARDDEDDALLNEEYGYESGILRDQPLYTAEESVVNGNHGGDYEFVNNEYGNVCMYIIPVLDAKDRIVALIGVDYAVDSIIDILNDNVKALVLQGLFITGLTVVIALLLIRKRIIRPIKSLSGRMAGFVQDRDKNPGSGVSKTFFEDEMTDIERSFDKMAEDISEYVGNIEK